MSRMHPTYPPFWESPIQLGTTFALIVSLSPQASLSSSSLSTPPNDSFLLCNSSCNVPPHLPIAVSGNSRSCQKIMYRVLFFTIGLSLHQNTNPVASSRRCREGVAQLLYSIILLASLDTCFWAEPAPTRQTHTTPFRCWARGGRRRADGRADHSGAAAAAAAAANGTLK
jgi:hypothetical protein